MGVERSFLFALLHFDSRIFDQLVPQMFPSKSVMLRISLETWSRRSDLNR
jgi:hypothetical protein